MVWTRIEKVRGRCSNGNMEDGSGWKWVDTEIYNEVERCHTKRDEGQRPENRENQNKQVQTQMGKRPNNISAVS